MATMAAEAVSSLTRHTISSYIFMSVDLFPISVISLFLDLGGVTFFHSCLSLFLYLQDGYTPLHMACRNGNEKIAEMLVTTGAHVEAKDNVRLRLTARLCLGCRGSRRIELRGNVVIDHSFHELLSAVVKDIMSCHLCRSGKMRQLVLARMTAGYFI